MNSQFSVWRLHNYCQQMYNGFVIEIYFRTNRKRYLLTKWACISFSHLLSSHPSYLKTVRYRFTSTDLNLHYTDVTFEIPSLIITLWDHFGGLHPTIDLDELKNEIENMGHNVINIANIFKTIKDLDDYNKIIKSHKKVCILYFTWILNRKRIIKCVWNYTPRLH